MDQYLHKILTARVYDVAQRTGLDSAEQLTQRIGNRILLKREDQQGVFSFKVRGAYNRIISLYQQDPNLKGVICASAGNHAQGVAFSARKLGLPAVIVMPRTTPGIKVSAVRRFGGEVVLEGDAFDEAYAHAIALQKDNDYAFIHPFDHADTIAGQGTVAMEICQQHADPIDAVFVPIGGGGLAAGIAVYLKSLRPEIKVIGVEPTDADCMAQSLRAGHPVDIGPVGIFADGVAVRRPGEESFRLCQQHLDAVVTCSVDEICAAVKDVFDETRTLLEPAGALALAGLKSYAAKHALRDKTLIAICSGANVNFDRLKHIAERAEIGEHREALYSVQIPERPGAYKDFCQAIGHRSITEFNYRYNDCQSAQIFVGVQVSTKQQRFDIAQSLIDAGYQVTDLTDNEMAKLHIRYMVGGHAKDISDERLLRFQFPERPGALGNFLTKLAGRWNISLFHYRNHGSAFGRVLCGMQVPEADESLWQAFLQEVGYAHVDETDNVAYRMFLH